MKPFRMLLWREARQAAPAAAAYLLGVALWTAFLSTRIGQWPDGAVAGLALLPVWILPPWALWRTFNGLRQDYLTSHAQLLLALPISGAQLTGAKLLVIWAEVVVHGAAITTALTVLVRWSGLQIFPAQLTAQQLALLHDALLDSAVAMAILILLVGVPAWLATAQAAWAVGRALPWAQGLVSSLAFLAGLYLLLRTGIAASSLLGWLPQVTLFSYVDFARQTGGSWSIEPRLLAIHPAPLVGMAAASLALFVGSARLLERPLDPGTSVWGVALAALVTLWFVATVVWFVATVVLGFTGLGLGSDLVDQLIAALRPTVLPGP